MKRLIFIIILLPAFIIGASADLDAAARDAGIYGVEGFAVRTTRGTEAGDWI